MDAPTFADVLAARRRIAPHLRPTPLYRYPALDAVAGTQVWVKHENHQPIGAFKVRGGVNLLAALPALERARGALEMFEEQPDLDVLVVPVGGGSGASGAGLVARAVRPGAEVVAVQSAAAPAAYRSWRAGRLVEAPMETFAEGLATGTAFELP